MKAVENGHRGSTRGEQELYASRNWANWSPRRKGKEEKIKDKVVSVVNQLSTTINGRVAVQLHRS
jgi:hypothetical protein